MWKFTVLEGNSFVVQKQHGSGDPFLAFKFKMEIAEFLEIFTLIAFLALRRKLRLLSVLFTAEFTTAVDCCILHN